MAKECLYDLLDNDGQMYVGGWRWGHCCKTCGNVSESANEEGILVNEPVVSQSMKRPVQTGMSEQHRAQSMMFHMF